MVHPAIGVYSQVFIEILTEQSYLDAPSEDESARRWRVAARIPNLERSSQSLRTWNQRTRTDSICRLQNLKGRSPESHVSHASVARSRYEFTVILSFTTCSCRMNALIDLEAV